MIGESGENNQPSDESKPELDLDEELNPVEPGSAEPARKTPEDLAMEEIEAAKKEEEKNGISKAEYDRRKSEIERNYEERKEKLTEAKKELMHYTGYHFESLKAAIKTDDLARYKLSGEAGERLVSMINTLVEKEVEIEAEKKVGIEEIMEKLTLAV